MRYDGDEHGWDLDKKVVATPRNEKDRSFARLNHPIFKEEYDYETIWFFCYFHPAGFMRS